MIRLSLKLHGSAASSEQISALVYARPQSADPWLKPLHSEA